MKTPKNLLKTDFYFTKLKETYFFILEKQKLDAINVSPACTSGWKTDQNEFLCIKIFKSMVVNGCHVHVHLCARN